MIARLGKPVPQLGPEQAGDGNEAEALLWGHRCQAAFRLGFGAELSVRQAADKR